MGVALLLAAFKSNCIHESSPYVGRKSVCKANAFCSVLFQAPDPPPWPPPPPLSTVDQDQSDAFSLCLHHLLQETQDSQDICL